MCWTLGDQIDADNWRKRCKEEEDLREEIAEDNRRIKKRVMEREMREAAKEDGGRNERKKWERGDNHTQVKFIEKIKEELDMEKLKNIVTFNENILKATQKRIEEVKEKNILDEKIAELKVEFEEKVKTLGVKHEED